MSNASGVFVFLHELTSVHNRWCLLPRENCAFVTSHFSEHIPPAQPREVFSHALTYLPPLKLVYDPTHLCQAHCFNSSTNSTGNAFKSPMFHSKLFPAPKRFHKDKKQTFIALSLAEKKKKSPLQSVFPDPHKRLEQKRLCLLCQILG